MKMKNPLRQMMERWDAQRAAIRAEVDATYALHLQQAAQRRREYEAPHIARLCEFTGRVIVVTNPGADEYLREKVHRPVAEAIHKAVPQVSRFGFSLHVNSSPSSGVDIGKGAEMIVAELSDLTTAQLTPLAGVRVGPRNSGLNVFELEDVVEDTFYDQDPDNTAHVAVTSALGIAALNLDYANAKYGDSFVLTGMSEAGDLRWDKIFQSPGGGTGPHHIS